MNTKNLPLLIGLILPVLFVVLIAIAIYVPAYFVQPAHNFLYTSAYAEGAYGVTYEHDYKVVNHQLELVPHTAYEEYIDDERAPESAPKLYIYDVTTETSHEITLAEASSYHLDPGPASPDGYTISYQYRHGDIFLFSSASESGYVIANSSGRKKLSGLVGQEYYGSNGVKIIGWIE